MKVFVLEATSIRKRLYVPVENAVVLDTPVSISLTFTLATRVTARQVLSEDDATKNTPFAGRLPAFEVVFAAVSENPMIYMVEVEVVFVMRPRTSSTGLDVAGMLAPNARRLTPSFAAKLVPIPGESRIEGG
jgi:hypothetical protein